MAQYKGNTLKGKLGYGLTSATPQLLTAPNLELPLGPSCVNTRCELTVKLCIPSAFTLAVLKILVQNQTAIKSVPVYVRVLSFVLESEPPILPMNWQR